MTKYLLLFRDNEQGSSITNEQTRLWDEWIGNIARQGVFDSGLPFGPHAKVIQGSANNISDYVQKPGDITGYIMIRTETLEKAVEIAKGAPTLAFGGTVEVRSTVPPPQM